MAEMKKQPADAQKEKPKLEALQALLGKEKLRLEMLQDAFEATKDAAKKDDYSRQADEKRKSVEKIEKEISDVEKQMKEKSEFKPLAVELATPVKKEEIELTPPMDLTDKEKAEMARYECNTCGSENRVTEEQEKKLPSCLCSSCGECGQFKLIEPGPWARVVPVGKWAAPQATQPPAAAPVAVKPAAQKPPERIPAPKPAVALQLRKPPEVKVKEEKKEKTALDWCDEGRALLYDKKPREALEPLGKALGLNQKLADAWYFKACALDELDRGKEALEACNRGLEADPNHKLLINTRETISARLAFESVPEKAKPAIPKAEEPKLAPAPQPAAKALEPKPALPPFALPKEETQPQPARGLAPNPENANSIYNKAGEEIGRLYQILIEADKNAPGYAKLAASRDAHVEEFAKVNQRAFETMQAGELQDAIDALLRLSVEVADTVGDAEKLPKKQEEQLIAPKPEQAPRQQAQPPPPPPPERVVPKPMQAPPPPAPAVVARIEQPPQLHERMARPAEYSIEDAIAEYADSLNKGKKFRKKKVPEGDQDYARMVARMIDGAQTALDRKSFTDFASLVSKYNQASAGAKAITRLYLRNFPKVKAELDRTSASSGAVSVDVVKSTLERRITELNGLEGAVAEAALEPHRARLVKISGMDLGALSDKERTDVLGELFSMGAALKRLRGYG